jgi:inosine-uridine nucleoside N-ribohydrolase
VGVPVILDTDIGFDVDDVWARVFLLRCPELDVKLITTTTGDTVYRARLVAKILALMGREDIPIGIGIPLDDTAHTHDAWLGDYELSDFAGTVLRDGVGAMCEAILESEEMVSLVCIGPLPNVAAALAREPEITNNARFIGMHGSLRKGYLGAAKPMREYNVKLHALACRAVFSATWEKIITPLDTCGTVMLEGERFAKVFNSASENSTSAIAIDNHLQWFEAVQDWPLLKDMDRRKQSSVLYDSVAVYLAFSTDFVVMETLPIVVTPDGKTVIDEAGEPVACAMEWRDKDAFLDLLVERLVS